MDQKFEFHALYKELLSQSQSLGQINVRQSLYISTLSETLSWMGGMKTWLLIHFMASVGVMTFSLISLAWAKDLALLCVAILSYVVALNNWTSFLCDLTIFLKGTSTENYIFTKLTKAVLNKFSLIIIPVVLFIVIAVIDNNSINFARKSIILLVVFTIIGFLLNMIAYSWKNITDYSRVLSAVLGSRTTIIKTKEELIQNIVVALRKKNLMPKTIDFLIRIAESDVRQSEVLLQLTNLGLALVAIIFTVLFSSQILSLLFQTYQLMNQTMMFLSNSIVNLIIPPVPLDKWLYTGIYIALWWQIINLLVGLIWVMLRSLINPYFTNYRPTHALYQALVMVNYETNQTQVENNLGFIDYLINSIKKILK